MKGIQIKQRIVLSIEISGEEAHEIRKELRKLIPGNNKLWGLFPELAELDDILDNLGIAEE